jgi:hypothetical protein
MRIHLKVFRSERVLWCAAIVVLITILAGVLGSIGNWRSKQVPVPEDPRIAPSHRFPLAISPDPIIFGTLDGRALVQRVVLARNTQNASLVLDRIQTSCPCIRMASLPIRMEANETQDWTVSFDPSVEPEFAGRLSIEVVGYLVDGQIAFRTHVSLDVEPAHEPRHE